MFQDEDDIKTFIAIMLAALAGTLLCAVIGASV